MAHIVIIGAGLGGVPMALEMRQKARRGDTVTVISDQPYFNFTPSNPWVAVDWRKPEKIRVNLAPVFKRKRIEFIHEAAARIEPDQNKVTLASGASVDYDYLIIATGPELAFDEIEGLDPEKGFTQSVCTADHSVTARDKWMEFVKDPGPVVVGAVQGASCFGPAYEFAFILDTDLRRRKIRDKVPMTFVTSEPYIGHLGLDGVGDTKGLLESEMRDRHVKFITNARVKQVLADKMIVEEVAEGGAVKQTHELPCKYSMMLPPFRGVKAVQGIEGLVNPRGFVLVDKTQQNKKFTNIFSVGVCVAIPPVGTYPVPVGVPKTGFMIESMVRATAHNIRALLDGKPTTHEATWNAVCIADFGDGGVAFVAMPQIPPRNVNWAADGKWVHLAKAAFESYFIGKMKRGVSEPFYERMTLDLLGITKMKEE
ncbi:MAG TPA: FAD-dependent oxidoreductase [Parvularculaceae bacterium]|nr:FAD-dependent oxidoreductase [Parvularculaceae bacterium]